VQRLRDRIAAWWPSASLRSYVIAIVLVATLPVVALMGFKIFGDYQTREERAWSELQTRAVATAQIVERELGSSIDALAILAGTTLAASPDTADLERALRVQPRLRPSWSGVFLLDATGRPLVDAGPIGAGPARMLDVERLRGAAQPVVSDLVALGADGRWATAVVVPVRDAAGLRYLLGAWIDAQAWQELLQKSGPPADGYLTLVDRTWRVVARTQSPGRFVGRQLSPDSAVTMARSASGVHYVEGSEGDMVYSAWDTVPGAGWAVRVSMAAEPLQAAMLQAIATTVAGALLCIVLGLYCAFLVARHLLEPLRRMAAGKGPQGEGRIVVREVAALRDALVGAQARDATAREQLQATADEFETLFSSSPIGLSFAHDPQCRDVTRNPAMRRLLGMDGPAGQVQILRNGLPLRREQGPLERAAATGQAVTSIALELVRPGGERTHVLAQAVPLLDADGRPRGAIGAFVDVTDQVQTDQELLAANERLRQSQRLVDLAQEAGHVGFFHYQFGDDQLAWTEGQAHLFGLSQQDAPAPQTERGIRDWGRLIDPQDRERVEQTLRRMFETGQEKETFEYHVNLPDGSTRWLSSRVLVLYAPDGRPGQMVGVSVDMTDEKLAERERARLTAGERTARIQAEAANRAKDEFLAMLGHELRNPLSAISAAIEVLNRVSADSEVAVNARNIAARQTRHLAHMMDDLLDVGRVVSGKVLLSRRPLDLAALAQRAVSTLEVTGEGRDHVLRLELEETWIDADATRIEQVLGNLLTNAAKYTPRGSTLTVSVRREGEHAVLAVADDGPGIPADLLPRIFDLFVQGERTPDRRAGGLGMGLTLAKRLVELHGGTIRAESSSAGSLFEVRIPAIPAPQAEPGRSSQAPSRGRRVVLVEDNEDALAGLRATLELDGHAVIAARDGPSGLQALIDTRPDVAIVDIGLPGITGLELAKRSRAAGFGGYMIALSGYGRSADVQEALKHGFDTHLVKPVDAQALQRLLAAA
jgi:signal transduction histidine kinase